LARAWEGLRGRLARDHGQFAQCGLAPGQELPAKNGSDAQREAGQQVRPSMGKLWVVKFAICLLPTTAGMKPGTCSRLLILAGPFFVLMLASAVASLSLESEPGMLAVAACSLAICVALIFCFVGIGLFVSAASQSSERALVSSLLVFVLVSALHDVLLISLLLRSALPPELVFGLAALNPSEAARVGILASADPELAVLGPVGFWLANSLGSAKAVALAIVWPLVLGGAATLAALRVTQRADLVA
jgi:hypothetical protein